MSDIINNIFDFIASKNLEKEKNRNVGFPHRKYVDLSTKSKEIDNMPPSELFISIRNLAGEYLQKKISECDHCHWVKSEMTHPTFDHLNFRYKNQLFSILIDIRDSGGQSFLPPEFIKRQLGESKKNNLIPCLFPVIVENMNPDTAEIPTEGWNLYSTVNGDKIVPENLISDEKIEMSDWELHNFAIMQMRYMMKQKNVKIISFQDIIGIDPQIWFEEENGNRAWAIVRYKDGIKPEDVTEITRRCFKYNGYLALFQFVSKSPDNKIYRGDIIGVNFKEFKQIHTVL